MCQGWQNRLRSCSFPPAYLAIVMLLGGWGCSGVTRVVRQHIAAGELRRAAVLAGDERQALTPVALAILARGMEDEEQRRRAARGLSGAGRRARGTLTELLESDDVSTSTAAAVVLAGHGSRRAEDLLRTRLAHELPSIRAAALRGLAHRRADPALFGRGLADREAEVRAAALTALGGVDQAPWAVDMLVRAHDVDPDWHNRAIALRSLARVTQGARLIDAAVGTLRDEDAPRTLRLAAVSALGRVESLQAVEPLLLQSLRVGSPAEQLEAAVCLARYGNAEGIAFLSQRLQSDAAPLARAAAIAAAQIGGPLVAALQDALRHTDEDVRLRAAEALLRLGEGGAARVELARLLAVPGWTGLHAALVLSRNGDETSEAAIRIAEALDDEDLEVRGYAAYFAGFLGNGMELGALAMRDEHIGVRVAGAAAYLQALRRDDLSRGRE